jgi:hypothetical protein
MSGTQRRRCAACPANAAGTRPRRHTPPSRRDRGHRQRTQPSGSHRHAAAPWPSPQGCRSLRTRPGIALLGRFNTPCSRISASFRIASVSGRDSAFSACCRWSSEPAARCVSRHALAIPKHQRLAAAGACGSPGLTAAATMQKCWAQGPTSSPPACLPSGRLCVGGAPKRGCVSQNCRQFAIGL